MTNILPNQAATPASPNEQFILAFKAKDFERVEKTLKDGADINTPMGPFQANALAESVNAYSVENVRWLLEHGANPNVMFHSSTPLIRTVTNTGQADADVQRRAYIIGRLLLENGADPNGPTLENKFYSPFQSSLPNQLALHKAVELGNEPMTDLLIKHGANIDLQLHNGATPLYHAALKNRLRMSCKLINAGANPTARTKEFQSNGWTGGVQVNKTILHNYAPYATRVGSEAYEEKMQVFRALLDAGADVFAKNEKGETPYQVISVQEGGQRLAELLKEYEGLKQFDPEQLGTLRRRNLFTVGTNGKTLFDSPSTWRHFKDITTHLKSIGEPLRIEDLQAKNAEGKTWLERGVECFAIKDILSYVKETYPTQSIARLLGVQGQPVDVDYITKETMPPALRIASERMQLNSLFNESVWLGRSKQELTAVFRHLPKNFQEDIDNYQRLLSKINPTPSKGSGLGRFEKRNNTTGMSM